MPLWPAPDHSPAGSPPHGRSCRPARPGRGQGREYNSGAEVMPGRIVENATARYQPQRGIVGRAVNGFRREIGFDVLAHAGDPENGRDPVGERHVDGVSGTQRPEAEENRGPLVAVDM